MIEKILGLVAAPVTAYRADGAVNLDVVSAYAQMLHANGVAGAFVNGTTGEGMSLTIAERRAVAERWVQTAPDGFKVIVHVGHACQKESVALAKHAVEIGAFAIGEIGPIFYGPDTVDALADYVAATASAAPELPYYYYHMPCMNQVEFPMGDLLERIGAVPNFTGIKYTFEDLDDYERCVQFSDGKYDALFGRDELLLEGLKRGAKGGVGSTYNFMVRIYHELTAAFKAGDEVEAQRLQDLAISGIKIVAGTGAFFSAAKAILRATGLELGTAVRKPLENLSDAAEKQMLDALREAGVWDYLNTVG